MLYCIRLKKLHTKKVKSFLKKTVEKDIKMFYAVFILQ